MAVAINKEGKIASDVCVVPLIKLALANRRPQGDFGMYIYAYRFIFMCVRVYICMHIYIDTEGKVVLDVCIVPLIHKKGRRATSVYIYMHID